MEAIFLDLQRLPGEIKKNTGMLIGALRENRTHYLPNINKE
jgi:hypothetical protein